MTLRGFANTQHWAVGVRLPTGCGLVLPQWMCGCQIMAWRGVGELWACRLYPVCAAELFPNQRRKQFPIISGMLCLLYFPL